MCTSPILIKNPKYKNQGFNTMHSIIQVPCGCCEECLRRRASDLFVRVQSEYYSCLRKGGCGFMCCLTYGLDLCPTLLHEGKKFKVFNKKHVIDFIKRLRINLERYFQKYYFCHSPKFKYVVTSEFGKSPVGSHLPHYHLIFLFDMPITLRAFRINYVKSLSNHRNGERYFGKIYQCDLLDPSKGGIKYSCKYILKDLMYDSTRKLIVSLIKFKKDDVEQRFGIIPFPRTEIEDFRNKCIRKSTAYLKAVEDECLPYRHMLQFCLCSNDLGISSFIERYGENLVSTPVLTAHGVTFAIPKSLRQAVEKNFGSCKSAELAKNVFLSSFEIAALSLISEHRISLSRFNELKDFVTNNCLFEGGFLFLKHENGVRERLFDNFEFPSYDDVFNEHNFFADNDFYSLREDVLQVIRKFNNSKRLEHRARLVAAKAKKEKIQTEQRKKNNGLL